MIRSVELELKTISEANAREFWRKRADRRSGQRDVVRATLNDQFGAAPLLSLVVDGWTRPNPIEITLTRLAPGELDPDENLPMSFKAPKDEIAAWLGVNDRDKRVRWRYAQEKTAAGIYKIRIEVADAAPGEDIRVQLASERECEGAAFRPLVKLKRGHMPSGQGVLALSKSYAAIPWEQAPCLALCRLTAGPPVPCSTCGGTGNAKARRLVHLARFDGLDNPPSTIDLRVPAEHLARWPGPRVKLHRRRFQSRATGECWLFEERTTT